ncbi:hypothetical protein SB775_06980 [Peribacillus sp. SIMBA_075]|uniref:hypothetical protein n=1 Tax=Peribacillus sp. SIMBA_075 TaxID=3085813 RepID=UPI00397E1F8E
MATKQIEVRFSNLPLEIMVEDYRYTFGPLYNYPNACSIEIKKQNNYVYENVIEDIRGSGDSVFIEPTEEFPETPVTKIIFC